MQAETIQANNAFQRFWNEDLSPWLKDFFGNEDDLEASINDDGSCRIDSLSNGYRQVGTMNATEADLLARKIASLTGFAISNKNPILNTEVEDLKCRISIVYPPCAAASTISIRKRASRLITLNEYVESGNLTQEQLSIIQDWILLRKNILVVGGTSSGKTTFINGLSAEISKLTPDHRIVILEDTVELQRFAENIIQLRSVEQVSLQELVKTSLRHRPDRIIVGEVRGKEAFDLLTAWSTGHPGGIASLHANSAEGAFTRLEQLLEIAINNPMQGLIGEAVDAIIFMAKTPTGSRKIQTLLEVERFDRQKHEYITQTR